jgi:predicted ATPase/class 3 adenylate cyclase
MDDKATTALRVLGPLAIVCDGEPVPLGSAQQRRLLAMLAVHANEVVSSDRLIDVVWGDGPPPSALHALRGLVSRLRATLGVERLETCSPGYRFRVVSGEVDALRFEALVRVGFGAAEQPEVARHAFDEALGLWRGVPYVEFADEEFASVEVARLVELRSRAIEERAGALLELGRPDEVIGDLEAEIASEPFRERLRALLMLALARAGRPVESLRAYDQFRRFLANEVGVAPSPALQDLHDGIVQQHPDVSWAGSPTKRTQTAHLPSGTVSFLFSDVEGSTRLWEEDPDLMRQLMPRHDQLLRDAVELNHGFIVKSRGDGFHAVFASAHDAVTAAVAAQMKLEADDWNIAATVRVRMGIHTGAAEARGGDYSGGAVNRAERLMSVAHGGQVVVSAATEELLHDALPDKYGLVDLGEHRLRDLGRPEHLFQVSHLGLGQDFPPLRTMDVVPPNNLPAPVDSFVGRRAELADVLDAIRDSRLTTLTGPGGSGKTRLALEAATAVLPSFRDGVWFVSLASAGTGARVVPLVAAALGVGEPTGQPVGDTLEQWLRDRQLVLLLDNCEPVVEAVGLFAERHLPRCPGLRILATSREVLGVRGERALSTPPLHVADDPALAGSSDAVELFMVRASAAASGFDADGADMATVAEICRRLDGLPLAIELAAVRVRVLSLEQIATRLGDRFRLRRAGERTLEATVACSYDLLTEAERDVFVRLGVFPAHFSLEAAEMVVSDAVIDVGDILDLLTRLVEKSLVTTLTIDGTCRYQLLETLREYALARLDERGETEWNDRLLKWAKTRVDHVEASLRRPTQDAALQSVTTDAVTLRAAMDLATGRGDQITALRIASVVPIGLIGERRRIIADVLDRVGRSADGWVAGIAHAALGELAYDQGDWPAASQAMTISREHFVAAGSDHHAAWADLNGAYAAWGMGELAEVDRVISAAITLFRQGTDALGLGYALSVASLRTPDLDEAKRLAGEADVLFRATGSPISIAHNVEGQGIIAYDRDELVDAAAFVAEAIQVFSRFGNPGCTAHALEAAAAIVGRTGLTEVATELVGAADELRRGSGAGHKPWEIRARHNDIDERVAPLSHAARQAALKRGRQHTLDSAARIALDALSTATGEVPSR